MPPCLTALRPSRGLGRLASGAGNTPLSSGQRCGPAGATRSTCGRNGGLDGRASHALPAPPWVLDGRAGAVAGTRRSPEQPYQQVATRLPSCLPPLPLPRRGVAYVKYDRASSAALAIEHLHEVTLNEGQGPRLKVLLADSPHTRWELR